MIYTSNAKWILYRIDSDGIKHIVKEYPDKPTIYQIIDLFIQNMDALHDKFRQGYLDAFNNLLDGKIVEIEIYKKKRFKLERNLYDVNYF
jgi:hypothetical protein